MEETMAGKLEKRRNIFEPLRLRLVAHPRQQVTMAEEVKECSACQEELFITKYSKKQWQAKSQRRCKVRQYVAFFVIVVKKANEDDGL